MPQFALIPALDWASAGLSLADIGALALFAAHADRHGFCHPAQAGIARRTGVSRSRLCRVVAKAEGLGLIAKEHRHRDNGGMSSCLYLFPRPEQKEARRDPPCAGERQGPVPERDSKEQTHSHHKKRTPSTPQGECGETGNERQERAGRRRRSRIDISALMERVVGRLRPNGEAEAPARDYSAAEVAGGAPEASKSRECPAGQAVVVAEPTLPLTAQDEALAGWVKGLVKDDTPVTAWPDAVREQALAGTAALELAVAHAEQGLRGCDPAIAAGVLGTFLSRIPLSEDEAVLEQSVVLDVRSMAQMPGDLLRLAAERMSAQWAAGFRQRPGAGDFRRLVREEMTEREEAARLLKDGLARLRMEQGLTADGRLAAFRERQAAKRAAEREALRIAAEKAKKPG